MFSDYILEIYLTIFIWFAVLTMYFNCILEIA